MTVNQKLNYDLFRDSVLSGYKQIEYKFKQFRLNKVNKEIKTIDNYCKKFIYDQNKLKRKIHENYYTYPLGHHIE